MVVIAKYNDESEKEITDYIITDGENLEVGKTSITISYTEGEITKTTEVEITVEEKQKLEIEIEELEEKQDEEITYIRNITVNTTIKELLKKIKTNGTVEVYEGETKVDKEDTKLKTGMTVKISLNEEEKEYIVVVTGDINGDGEITSIDAYWSLSYAVDTNETSSIYLYDVNNDGKLTSFDALLILRHLVGISEL